MDDLGHGRGCRALHLDDIWTRPAAHAPTFGHADHGPGRGVYSKLSSSDGQVAEATHAPAEMRWTVSVSPSQPTLPSNRAFVVQFRAQPSGALLPWAGRVEHVVSHQGARFHSLDELLAFMTRVLTQVEAQSGAQ